MSDLRIPSDTDSNDRPPVEEALDVRSAPVQVERAGRIPWSRHLRAYEAYARRYGRRQSAERIAERGGFGWAEVAFFLDEEVDRLLGLAEGLCGYAQHKDDCRIFWPIAGIPPTCDCGLEPLLGLAFTRAAVDNRHSIHATPEKEVTDDE